MAYADMRRQLILKHIMPMQPASVLAIFKMVAVIDAIAAAIRLLLKAPIALLRMRNGGDGEYDI